MHDSAYYKLRGLRNEEDMGSSPLRLVGKWVLHYPSRRHQYKGHLDLIPYLDHPVGRCRRPVSPSICYSIWICFEINWFDMILGNSTVQSRQQSEVLDLLCCSALLRGDLTSMKCAVCFWNSTVESWSRQYASVLHTLADFNVITLCHLHL